MLVYVEFGNPVGDYCEATSLSFGMQSSPAAGGAQRRAQVNPVSFTKNHDAFTSTLFRHCLSGTQFGTVSIEMYRSATSGLTILYTMSDVVISQINSGSGEDDFVGLDYRTMKYAYYGE